MVVLSMTRMPFGITNGFKFSKSNRELDSTYQINEALCLFRQIIIGSESKEKHEQNLKLFLSAAKDANPTFTKLNLPFLF